MKHPVLATMNPAPHSPQALHAAQCRQRGLTMIEMAIALPLLLLFARPAAAGLLSLPCTARGG